jgi:phosphoribosylanthranilate isomerase
LPSTGAAARQRCSSSTRSRRALPSRVTLVQVVQVTGPFALDEALAVAPLVDALLLDSGNPALAVKQLGGTGRTHDWAVSREIVQRAGVPACRYGWPVA